MRLQVVHRISELEALEEEWTDLLPRSTCNTIFLSHPWSLSWWEAFGAERELHLLTLESGGALRGIAPLYLDQDGGRQVVKFVGGTDLSDHLDILSERGQELAVQRAVLDHFERQASSWQAMSLWNLPEDCRARPSLVELAREKGWTVRLEQQDVAPYIPLPSSWEAYLEGLAAKQRHETRRRLRRAEREAQVEWWAVDDPAELERTMDDFLRLFRLSSEAKRAFMTERMEGFFRSIVTRTGARGWARLYFIRLDGQLAASILTFDYAGGIYVYNSGYDPRSLGHLSPGIVLFTYAIRDAIERGRQRFDLLRGGEAYKYRLGAVDRVIYRLQIERDGEQPAVGEAAARAP